MRFLSSVSFRVQTVETKFDDREISTIKYKVFFSYTVLLPHPSGRKTYIKKERKKIISVVHARVDDIQSDSINFSSGTAPRHPGKSCVPTARDKTSSSSVSFSPFRCTYGAGVRANQVACDCHCRRGEGLYFLFFFYILFQILFFSSPGPSGLRVLRRIFFFFFGRVVSEKTNPSE